MSKDNDTKTKKALDRLLLCSGIYLTASFLPIVLPAAGVGVLSSEGSIAISGAIASVIAGNTANALDNVFSGKEPEPNLLATEDLTKAVGRAIAFIISKLAEDKQYDGRTRRHLRDIAKEARDNWVAIARRKISEADYQELRENRLDEMLRAEGESFTKETAMTPEVWLDVFAVLNMAAKAGGGFRLERSVWETVAEKLHTLFPKALRQQLKEDFKADGRAFAGLVLLLLTDIKTKVATLKLTEAELEAVNRRLGEVIHRLSAGEEEQRAFFGEIANNMEKMASQIEDLHQTLCPPPPTRQRWRELCGQMLEQLQLRTNVFTNNSGVSPIIKDLYVPLALVERREKPQLKPNSREAESPERKETEEQLVPVSEDEFLREVLRLGQSKSQGKRIAVVGEPGSGKTTRLQFIADWILEEDLGLPVWVSLADLDGRNVSTYLESAWLPMLPEVEVSLKELKGQAENIWLLLDGLDEMTARIESRHVDSLLRGWVDRARVIVSCRTNVWEADRNAFSGFDVFRNLEFAPAQVEDYIRRWFERAIGRGSLGEELLEQLAQSPNQRLRDLIGNPLRLWMLCQIWHPEVGLPETQAELYGEFVDWVYRWKAEEEVADRREEINSALAGLALAAMEGSDRLRLPEKLVREQLKEPWIFQAVKRLGWLNVVSREGREAVYGFYHLTFLEYFAALAVPGWRFFLNHVPGNPGQGVYRIFAPEWKQVILLWLGRDDVDVGEKEEFVRELVEFEDGCGEWNLLDVDRGFYEYRAYFLAAAGINEFRGCSLAGEIVEQIVRWGFGYFSEKKQEWWTYIAPIETNAREILKETIRDRAITALEELLTTATDKYTTLEAAESLEQIAPGNEKALAALEKLLATSTDEWLRGQTAESLGQIAPGNEKAIIALVELVATTADENTRIQAAKSLGQIATGNEKAIIALVELVATSTDYVIRRLAAYSLGQIAPGNQKAITALEKLLASSADDLTRWEAARGLAKIAPGSEKAITVLVELLASSADDFTRWQTARDLAKIAAGSEKAITVLVELVATSTDDVTRGLAAYNLGRIALGREKTITVLEELVATSTDDVTRGLAAYSLGQIAPGHEKAITTLEELLATTTLEDLLATATDKNTSLEALKSLGQIAAGHQKAITTLEELLATTLVELLATTTDKLTRWLAAEYLGQIAPGNEKAITALLDLLATSTDEDTRWQAARELAKIAPGNEKAITALLDLLATSADEYTLGLAAQSLREILNSNEQYCQVVLGLKHYLSNGITNSYKLLESREMPEMKSFTSLLKWIYHIKSILLDESYQVIWQCAENLPYPEFYRAWHERNQTAQVFNLRQKLTTAIAKIARWFNFSMR